MWCTVIASSNCPFVNSGFFHLHLAPNCRGLLLCHGGFRHRPDPLRNAAQCQAGSLGRVVPDTARPLGAGCSAECLVAAAEAREVRPGQLRPWSAAQRRADLG